MDSDYTLLPSGYWVNAQDNTGPYVKGPGNTFTLAGTGGGGGGGGGGGPVTVADGADVAQGAVADAAVVAGATGTLSAKLRAISRDIGTLVSAGVGSASTVADGADVTQGALADAVVAAGAAGSISAKLRRLTTDTSAILAATTPASTVADGADITLGAIADAAVTAGATGTVSAKLRSISRDLVPLGATADAAASSDTGTFSLISLTKRLLSKLTTAFADGGDATQGAIADAAVTAGATGSLSAKLRAISRDIGAMLAAAPADTQFLYTPASITTALTTIFSQDVTGYKTACIEYINDATAALTEFQVLSKQTSAGNYDQKLGIGNYLNGTALADDGWVKSISPSDPNTLVASGISTVRLDISGIKFLQLKTKLASGTSTGTLASLTLSRV